MKSLLQNKKVKILFSIVILISSIPAIYEDIINGYQGTLSHYGLFIIGLSSLLENLLWVLDVWQDQDDDKILLEDLKDFYVWKQYINDPKFKINWGKNREEVLKNVDRPKLYK